jgi:hypothetical protein
MADPTDKLLAPQVKLSGRGTSRVFIWSSRFEPVLGGSYLLMKNPPVLVQVRFQVTHNKTDGYMPVSHDYKLSF